MERTNVGAQYIEPFLTKTKDILIKMNISPKGHRQSIRLKAIDYSQAGAYFITICTNNKRCHFGRVEGEMVKLTPIGEIANKYWLEICEHFDNVLLDDFVVMPNHIHGILFIPGAQKTGVQYIEPLQQRQQRFQHVVRKSIGSIVRSFKAAVTRWCRKNGYDHFRWQRSFYDHIIRNEKELNQKREYILNNPLKWELDKENPQNWQLTV
jgi:putative transposase